MRRSLIRIALARSTISRSRRRLLGFPQLGASDLVMAEHARRRRAGSVSRPAAGRRARCRRTRPARIASSMNAGVVLIDEQHDRSGLVGGDDADALERVAVGTRHVDQHDIRGQRGHRVGKQLARSRDGGWSGSGRPTEPWSVLRRARRHRRRGEFSPPGFACHPVDAVPLTSSKNHGDCAAVQHKMTAMGRVCKSSDGPLMLIVRFC